MQYRTIPGTDISVSVIGFGSGDNAGLMVRGDSSDQLRVVAHAVALGINYFDTSPDYGDGAAEQALGRALREAGAGSASSPPVITTKVEVRQRDLPDIAGHVVRSAHASMRRLGVERLDVLQIHNGPAAAPPDITGGGYRTLWIEHFLGPRGAVEGLLRLQRDGVVRHAGFVCRGNDEPQVRRLLDTGLFRLLNLPCSLINPTAAVAPPTGLPVEEDYGRVLDTMARARCGAAIFSPLAGGFLTGTETQHALARPLQANSDAARRKRAAASRFRFLADHFGGSLPRAAYRFVLTHPSVSTVIGGFSSFEQLDEVAPAADSAAIDAGLMGQIEHVWATPRDPSA